MQIKVMQVGQLGTNCYLLEDEETRTAAVVDPGGEGARILAQLKADGMELKLILLTHAHFDHTGGVAELCAALPGVPVYLHPADAALVGGDVFPAVGAETTPYQDGDVVKLTATETRIVDLLMRNPGRVLPAEEIYRRVWDGEAAYACENTVMVHIRRIREKIELNPKEPDYIKVVWGIGYKMEQHGS